PWRRGRDKRRSAPRTATSRCESLRRCSRTDCALPRLRHSRSARARRPPRGASCARLVEPGDVVGRERERERPRELRDLRHRGGARDRRCDCGLRHDPGERNLRARRAVARRHRVERREHGLALAVEMLDCATAAHALRLVGARPILPVKKPLASGKYGMIATPSLSHSGMRSFSISRFIKLYSGCCATNETTLFLLLSPSDALKRATPKFDAPTARTLPART